MATATPIRVSGDMVIIPANEYNQLLEAQNRVNYLAMLDKSYEELAKGEVVVKSMEELRAME